jgi:hypothetical protein
MLNGTIQTPLTQQGFRLLQQFLTSYQSEQSVQSVLHQEEVLMQSNR